MMLLPSSTFKHLRRPTSARSQLFSSQLLALPRESRPQSPASVILVMTSMPSRTPKSSTTLLDAPDLERERVFDLFRHWGYLEADLDPLGLLRPQPQPELQIDNDFARE